MRKIKNLLLVSFILFLLSGCISSRYYLQDKGKDRYFLTRIIRHGMKNGNITLTPVLVIDGRPYRYQVELKQDKLNLYRYTIKSIDVLKKKKAVEIYGKEGERGVLIISTVNDGIDNNKEPMIVIDGKTSTMEEMQKLNPMDIESIEILKSKDTVQLFTNEPNQGVIVIHLKKK